HFGIDQLTVERLDEIMEKRQETKATNFKRDEKIDRFVEEHSLSEGHWMNYETTQADWDNLQGPDAYDPSMDSLTYLWLLQCRLVELRVRRKAEQDEDLRKLAQHLCICADRSFTAISLVKKVGGLWEKG
ncbi:SRP54, partial [Symbiodinium sp. KB8]